MFVNLLTSPTDDEAYVPTDEVVRRIAVAFRRVVLDREQGDSAIRKWHRQLRVLGEPESVLNGYLSQLGTLTHVTLSDGSAPEEAVGFLLRPDHPIVIEYPSDSDRERLRPTVRKLADLLGYQLGEGSIWLEVDISLNKELPVDDEFKLRAHLEKAVERRGIGEVDVIESGISDLRMIVVVQEEEVARRRLTKLFKKLLPKASVTIDVLTEEDIV